MYETDHLLRVINRSTLDGLTAQEVAQRVRAGQTNQVRTRTSRSVGEIVRSNVFTFFNGLLVVMLVAILALGSPKDALFGIVLVLNMAIGITQELRAKRTLDRLSVLAAPTARVVRDAESSEVAVGDVVLGDVIELHSGDQVVADGEVLSSAGLDIDEALLTGESRPTAKAAGDPMMSGSFCVGGTGRMRVTAVGSEAYVSRLTEEARHFRRTPSELRRGTDRILKVTTIAMVPIGLLLILSSWRLSHDVHLVVPEVVGALVGMIPQGFVLLTSIAFAASVLKLARQGALIEELPAVEVLARVDVVCIDKTGTLTEPVSEVGLLEPTAGQEALAREALGALAALEPADSRNATARALAAEFPPPQGWQAVTSVPFSSTRRWRGADFGAHGVWLQGAPDVLLPVDSATRARAGEIAASGQRALVLARAKALPALDEATGEVEPVAVIGLHERVRDDAAATLAYFREQGVQVRVISGDAAATVAAVARRVGIDVEGDPVDATTLSPDPVELAAVMEANNIFGRVRPDQKRNMVAALQKSGHVVAMTGDGVNDTRALKQADMGIAMGSGAQAAKAVAELVLIDGRFSVLPGVVAEGRRVMSNAERVANLFVTKTVYAALLALGAGLLAMRYPLLPRHFTLVDAFTIGIPGFFLALAPAAPRYRPGFLRRVLAFTGVCGTVAAVATAGAYRWALGVIDASRATDVAEARTVAVLTLILVGTWVLLEVALPLTRGRAALIVSMLAGVGVVMLWPFARGFFALPVSPAGAWLVIGVASAAAVVAMELGLRLVGWRQQRAA
jgi:cation-transporting ATPase E